MAFEVGRGIQTVVPPSDTEQPNERLEMYDRAMEGDSSPHHQETQPQPQEETQPQPDPQSDGLSRLNNKFDQFMNVMGQYMQMTAGGGVGGGNRTPNFSQPEVEDEVEVDEYNVVDNVKGLNKQLRELKEQNKTLQQLLEGQQETYHKDKYQTEADAVNRAVNLVHQEMDEQGYKDFKSFGVSIVRNKINELNQQGRVQEAQDLYHSPEKWGAVYKQSVDSLVNQRTQGNNNNKTQQLAKNQPISSPGVNPNRGNDDTDEDPVNSWDAYIKNRQPMF